MNCAPFRSNSAILLFNKSGARAWGQKVHRVCAQSLPPSFARPITDQHLFDTCVSKNGPMKCVIWKCNDSAEMEVSSTHASDRKTTVLDCNKDCHGSWETLSNNTRYSAKTSWNIALVFSPRAFRHAHTLLLALNTSFTWIVSILPTAPTEDKYVNRGKNKNAQSGK